MLRRVSIRFAAVALAAGSLATIPLATPASAVIPPHVVCSKLVATTTIAGSPAKATTKSAISMCTPAALSAGGSSTTVTPASQLFGKITNKITWKNGKGTTTVVQQYKTVTGTSKCPKGQSHIKLTGTTKTSTGAAAKIIKAGEPITASICTNTSKTPYVSTLEPGTKFKL